MKPVHEIMNKIKWDKNENPGDYIIGYWDRIEKKTIFIKLSDLEKSDIPYHRIRYIKKKGQVVWKR